MEIFEEPSVRFAERGGYIFKEQEGSVFLGLSRTGRRQQKLKARAKSEVHIFSSEAKKAETRALQQLANRKARKGEELDDH